jgi:hypothetical protein
LFVIGAPALPSKTPVGGAFADRCIDLAKVRATIKDQYTKLIEITPGQWRFLRGVYAMNVEAPPGLPFGDDVVLAQGGGDALLFFVDGDKLGAPMHAPPALLWLIEQQRWPTVARALPPPPVTDPAHGGAY